MTSGELAHELMYYGVSAICLVTTGSEQGGPPRLHVLHPRRAVCCPRGAYGHLCGEQSREVTTEQPSRSPFAGTTSISPCASLFIKECARACLFCITCVGRSGRSMKGGLVYCLLFLLLMLFPPLAALSVEGFPPVVVLPVAVVIRLREVVVLFVEDEA